MNNERRYDNHSDRRSHRGHCVLGSYVFEDAVPAVQAQWSFASRRHTGLYVSFVRKVVLGVGGIRLNRVRTTKTGQGRTLAKIENRGWRIGR